MMKEFFNLLSHQSSISSGSAWRKYSQV
jgi:hypothetical protein